MNTIRIIDPRYLENLSSDRCKVYECKEDRICTSIGDFTYERDGNWPIWASTVFDPEELMFFKLKGNFKNTT